MYCNTKQQVASSTTKNKSCKYCTPHLHHTTKAKCTCQREKRKRKIAVTKSNKPFVKNKNSSRQLTFEANTKQNHEKTKRSQSDSKMKERSITSVQQTKRNVPDISKISVLNNRISRDRETECLKLSYVKEALVKDSYDCRLSSQDCSLNVKDDVADCERNVKDVRNSTTEENLEDKNCTVDTDIFVTGLDKDLVDSNVGKQLEQLKTRKAAGKTPVTGVDNNLRKQLENTPNKTISGKCPATPVKIKSVDHLEYVKKSANIRHVCEYCQKVFKSNCKLNIHIFSHTGEKPFKCPTCEKGFSSNFKLVRHILIHSKVRKFICPICDRTFLRNDHLKNHIKIHDPLKNIYKCDREGCSKEYSSHLSLKKHMALHCVEDGCLTCLLCTRKYETKEEIQLHLKSHSGSRLFKNQNDKKFKCQHCDRLFLTSKDVTRHLVVHTGNRDFLCQFCPQRFGRKDHLVRHIKKSHLSKTKLSERISGLDNVSDNNSDVVVIEDPSCSTVERADVVNKPETKDKFKEEFFKYVFKNLNTQSSTDEATQTPDSFKTQEEKVPDNSVPLQKKKIETITVPPTQIVLQTVPNILIIPNNSIILLQNQDDQKPDDFGFTEKDFLNTDNALYEASGFPSYNYEHFEYPTSFDHSNQNLGELNMEDMLSENVFNGKDNNLVTENLLTEASRQIKLLETQSNLLTKDSDQLKMTIDKECKIEEKADEIQSLLSNDSMALLNQLEPGAMNINKDMFSNTPIDSLDGAPGILDDTIQFQNSSPNQLLSNLLNSNDIFGPLPGFRQIFQSN